MTLVANGSEVHCRSIEGHYMFAIGVTTIFALYSDTVLSVCVLYMATIVVKFQ